VGQRRFINPLLLDIALLETLSLFDKARAQAERHRSIIHESRRRFKRNNVLVSDITAVFFKFLRRLLWSIFSPIILLGTLETELDLNATQLRSVIISNNDIASNLRREEEHSQKTLDELKRAQDFIQTQMEPSTQKIDDQSSVLREIEILKKYVEHTTIEIKEEKRQQMGPGQTGMIERQYEQSVQLKKQWPKVDKECRQWNQTLEGTKEEGNQKRTEIVATVKRHEEKLEEAERNRREWENKTFLGKVWAWLMWLSSCGSGD